MKLWIIAVISMVVGTAVGLGSVWLEFSTVDAQFEPHNQASGSTVPRETAPRVVVPDPEYDFGVGQRNSKMKHIFVVRNEGNEPLTLEAGDTTCKCTLSKLKDGHVEPGGSAEVLLDWKLLTLGSDFRQSANIQTNDPENETVTLVIHGEIVDRVKLEPSDIVLTSVSVSEGTMSAFHLFGYEDEVVEVTSYEFVNEETQSFFDLTFEEVEADTLAEEENATCGIALSLLVKPGLPLGPINQTIRLETNIQEVGTLELSVTGSVVSDISIVGGREFVQKLSVLRLGTVDSKKGRQESLRILVKGPHRDNTQFEIKQVDPDDVLEVSLSEPKSLNNGAVYMHTLTIKVPEDARLVNRLGGKQSEYGKIVLETTHPDVKTIPIYVRFAVR